MAKRKLSRNVTVTVRDEEGNITGGATYGPDYPGDVPDWALAQLKDADVWQDSEAEPTEAPRSSARRARRPTA